MSRESLAVMRAMVRAARPWSLLVGILLYTLGGGIAHYLGNYTDIPVFSMGLTALMMFQLGSYFLREYFGRVDQPPFENPLQMPSRRKEPPASTPEGEEPAPEVEVAVIVPRVFFLQVAAATLTIAAVMIVLLYAEQKLNPAALVLIVLAFILAMAYAVPPVRLVDTGYGELILAILFANLFPAIAFVLQEGDVHRLLAMLTFPLTFLYLAAELARALENYFEDVKNNRKTMLVRLGWQRGMTLHNALIALAYVVLAVSVIYGLPWRLAYPAFLSLPVGIFEIWQMNSIAGGAKPHWRLLAFTALATVGFTVYFMNLALWIG